MSTAAQLIGQRARPILEAISELVGRTRSSGASGPSAEVLERLRALSAEHARLLNLVDDERREQAELEQQIAAKNAERMDALANARRQGSEEPRELANELLEDTSDLRRRLEESKELEVRFQREAEEVSVNIDELSYSYRAERTAFLDQMYSDLINAYMELAPELADIVLQIAAVRRVMVATGTGNTNGWNGRIFLPTMAAKEGRELAPIADGATSEFDAAASQRMSDVYQALQAAGFTFG